MSSSPRQASEFNAILMVEQGVGGPIILPMTRKQAFVAEFNATYGRIGLTIERIPDLRELDSRKVETPLPLAGG